MQYRIDRQGLFNSLSGWDAFLKRRVHLIACGGTALTLLGIKASTKDIDLMVPEISEHRYLVSALRQLGYRSASGWGWKRDDGFIFDLFKGKAIHTTELLESPLEEGNHIFVKEFTHIYLGILNYYDLITSKLFRATAVDIEDCVSLMESKGQEIDLKELEKRFFETATYDVSEDSVKKNLEYFTTVLHKRGIT